MRTFNNQEIAQIFSKARRVLKHPGFDILVIPARFASARLLVITPKKIGNAPERNKVRRRIKAIFHEAAFSTLPVDCIIIIKPEGVHLPFATLQETIVGALTPLKKS